MNRKFSAKVASAIVAGSVLLSGSSVLQKIPTEADTVNAAGNTIPGDCNDSGSISAADAMNLHDYLLSRSKSISSNADINNDKTISSIDMILMRQLLAENSDSDKVHALTVNEVCSTNKNGITDAYGENADWIELYNGSGSDIPLKGYGLSDKSDEPFKFTFPDVTIKANSCMIVFATKDFDSVDNELHAPFGISKSGETIYLTHPSNGTIDVLEIPALESDTSYGRYKDGTNSLSVLETTPGDKNKPLASAISAPVFSAESGFYDSEFSLSITAPQGCKIYYTTDGSVPTAESNQYTGSINIRDRSNEPNVLSTNRTVTFPDGGALFVPSENIAKSNVIKAIAVDSNGNCSDVITKTYFVGLDQQTRYNSLPVISITMDQNDLFDYDTGIYTTGYYYDEFLKTNPNVLPNQDWLKEGNFTQSGIEWEKPVHIDFFEQDGSLAFAEDVGMRIQGGASRSYVQKSLKFFARAEYGSGTIKYELIPEAKTVTGETNSKYDKFIIRNGANDCNSAKFRDPMLQELVSDRNFETQQGRPVIAFLNGEYWGVYQITEDYSDSHINEIYGYPKDEVVIIKCGEELEEGVESDLDDYYALLDYVRKTDLSVDANYNEFCSMVDVQSMADYYAAQIYINNQDVFRNDGINNYRMWKTRTALDDAQGDGRWRWMLYDVDYSSDVYSSFFSSNLDALTGALNESADAVIFAKTFKQNKQFRELFLNTIMDITNENFSKENVEAAIDKYTALYSPVMTEHIKRFGPQNKLQNTSNAYKNEIDRLKSFLLNRPNQLIKGFQQYCSSGTAFDLNISVNNPELGTVQINTITPDIGSHGWSGKYFGDIPVTITAVPENGSVFLGWSGDVESSEAAITVTLSKAMNLKADFSDN